MHGEPHSSITTNFATITNTIIAAARPKKNMPAIAAGFFESFWE